MNTVGRLKDKLGCFLFTNLGLNKTTTEGKVLIIYMILQSRLFHKHHVLTLPKLEEKDHILLM